MFPQHYNKTAELSAPGLHRYFYLAPLSWFDELTSPPATSTTRGGTVLNADTHTFLNLPVPSPAPSPMPSPLPKYGFIKIYTTMGTAKATMKQVGSPDNWNIEGVSEGFHPGIDAAMAELMYEEDEYVLLMGLKNCAEPTFIQYGDLCDPCMKDGWEWTSGVRGGTDKLGFTIKFKSIQPKPMLYTGTVTVPGAYA